MLANCHAEKGKGLRGLHEIFPSVFSAAGAEQARQEQLADMLRSSFAGNRTKLTGEELKKHLRETVGGRVD